jgi:hypothetical protein
MSVINISQQSVKGNCDLKCDYNFKYHKSNSIATNAGSAIQISYEDSGIPPVTYNNVKYNVDYIVLTYPSYVLYNGNNAIGNLEILHTSVKDKSVLVVLIPLTISDDITKSSTLINNIISAVSNNAPNLNENVTLNISDFTLQDLVPKKPFYTGTSIFNLIFFDLDGAISISQSSYNTLTKIISLSQGTETPSQLAIIQSSSAYSNDLFPLFYNSKGPNNSNNNVDGDIYISCQPTGNSNEEKLVSFTKEKNPTTTFELDLKKLFKNPYFIYFFYALLFIILLVFISLLINTISSSSIKIPFITKKHS